MSDTFPFNCRLFDDVEKPYREIKAMGALKSIIKCSACNNKLRAGATFCDSCGEKQKTSDFCISCNYELRVGATFCDNCGEKQTESFNIAEFKKHETYEETPASDFEYRIIDDIVIINDYIGNSETVQIPKNIEGLPV